MSFPPPVLERARRVSLVCFDVDGVLTDGRIVYSDKGEELKAFQETSESPIAHTVEEARAGLG